MRELVELAARRTSELHNAMARARAASCTIQVASDTCSSRGASLAIASCVNTPPAGGRTITGCASVSVLPPWDPSRLGTHSRGASIAASSAKSSVAAAAPTTQGASVAGASAAASACIQIGSLRSSVLPLRSSCRSMSPGGLPTAPTQALQMCTPPPPPVSRTKVFAAPAPSGVTPGSTPTAAPPTSVVEGLNSCHEKVDRRGTSPIRGRQQQQQQQQQHSLQQSATTWAVPPTQGATTSVHLGYRLPPSCAAAARGQRQNVQQLQHVRSSIARPNMIQQLALSAGIARAQSVPRISINRLASVGTGTVPSSSSPAPCVVTSGSVVVAAANDAGKLTASAPVSNDGAKLTTGHSSPIRPLIEFVQGNRVWVRARVYLYQAPFAPSVSFARGAEQFLLPLGWAVIRSRQGMLVWLELLSDDGSPAPGALCSELAKAFTAPVVAHGNHTPSVPIGNPFGQVDVQQVRTCNVDVMMRVPCEDLMVLHTSSTSNGGGGLRAVLGGGPSRLGLDCLLKGWLSAWEAQV